MEIKMIRLSKKGALLSLLALLSLGVTNSSLSAQECCDPCNSSRLYIGAFGGGIYSDSTHAYQMGTAFFTEANGGPLAVYAHGDTKSTSAGFGGVQVGYELSQCPMNLGCSNFSISPAFEVEAFWYKHTKKGHLINTTDRLPEHDFLDTFPMHTGVYLANVVLSFNTDCMGGFTPYIGGGIGAARISIKNADSLQTDPPEEDVNHFNSLRNDSSWAFAAQAKVGIRYNICQSFHVFGEYRYLFIDYSNYIFGSTVYDDHAPTSPWNVKVQNLHSNAFVFGIQYDL